MYSGDEEVLHGLYPHVNRILQFFEASRNEFGMLSDLGTWVFIDWADIDRKGECAPLNALFIGTLEFVRKMAEFKNDHYMIDYCLKTSNEMKELFNKRYWCEDRGIYADSLQEMLSAIDKPENKASRRVIEKLGFIYCDTRRLPYDGKDCDFNYFRLYRTDYLPGPNAI